MIGRGCTGGPAPDYTFFSGPRPGAIEKWLIETQDGEASCTVLARTYGEAENIARFRGLIPRRARIFILPLADWPSGPIWQWDHDTLTGSGRDSQGG